MIEWKKLEQPEFDTIVELLLLRTNRGQRVDIVDGRGGDGGIDVRVVETDGKVTIYQLKFFPEGMSNGHRPRRAQVTNSFRSAVTNHKPDNWVLVIPRNLTIEEQLFVRDLPKTVKTGVRKPRVRWLGKTELDDLITDHPAVEHYFNRSTLQEQLIILGAEQAILAGGSADLAQRVTKLSSVVDSVDPHWTLDFERRGNTTFQTLRPQHDNATELAPIELRVTGLLDQDSQLAAQLQQMINYGGPDEVSIPREYISEFSITGSPLIESNIPPEKLTLRSLDLDVPAKGSAIEFEFFTSDDKPIGSYEGIVSNVYGGEAGFTTCASLYSEHVTITLRLPVEQRAGDTHDLSLSYRLQGLRPSEVTEVLEFTRLIKSSPRVHVTIDGNDLTKFFRAAEDKELSEDAILIAGFANDLDIIYRHLNWRHLFPEKFTIEDCINARVTRRLIEGYSVASPIARSVTCILESGAKLNDTLRYTLEDVINLRIPAEYSVGIAGRNINLGRVFVTHPKAQAVNGSEAIQHLREEAHSEFHVRFHPIEDPYFYLYRADHGQQKSDQLEVVSWNIPGIEEPWLDHPWIQHSRRIGR